ncbi:MAG: VOC family protein [Alphaproteobacteria bacterium]
MDIKPALIPELKISNFQESLKFYTEIAGFKVEYSRPEHDFAMLSREHAWLMIEGMSENTRTFEKGKLEYPFGKGAHFQVQVLNVDRLFDTFKKVSYPIFLDMEEKWYRRDDVELGNKQFLVQDPDGYLFRFYQDLGKREVKR